MVSCDPPAPVGIGGPILSVDSPLELGDSPKGISVRQTLKLSNTGDATLTLKDFELKPDDAVFQLGITELPLVIKRGRSTELEVTFRPKAETDYEAELRFEYDPGEHTPPDLLLRGTGISNLVCLSCEPPPPPECRLDGDVSVYFESTSSTDCENEDGICSYLMFEEICEHGPCDEDTQQCPLPAHWDAGQPIPDAGQPVPDAGQAIPDAGQPITDAGWIEPDFYNDDDADGIINGEDDYPNHHNGDLQFIIDLISQSDLTLVPLELGSQLWENGRLVEAHFANTGLTGPLPDSLENPVKLTILDLEQNGLSGELPQKIGQLTLLVKLDLFGNNFTGELPTALGDLAALEFLRLNYNDFSGSIPIALGHLNSLTSINLSNNSLSGPIPPELGNLWCAPRTKPERPSGPPPPEGGRPWLGPDPRWGAGPPRARHASARCAASRPRGLLRL